MRRRNFIKKVGFAAGAPIAFQGVPLKILAGHEEVKLAAQSTNDRVLVIIQMHGGNDGLNTFVPLAKYDEYYFKRANIALPYKVGARTIIPLDSTVPSEDQVGLHPDMEDFKYLYDTGRAAVFQGVSYDNNNGSHFRGRDIWNMGGNSDEYLPSGWVGRYLINTYSPLSYPDDFPNDNMPDPLALEMGNDVSLLFHQESGIPVSLSLGSNPVNVNNQIESLEGFTDEGIDPRGTPPEFLTESPYGKEMDWILGLENKSEIYIKRLAELYEGASETTVTYPDIYPFGGPENIKRNPLSSQMQLIARLLDGGVKTKVFLVKIGGFDTHASQVEENDATMGTHASKLYHITSAMRAFQDDLKSRGLEERVLTVTMSEFGRRIEANGSFGTDHGTGAPMMLFGKWVSPSIYGTSPDLTQRNIGLQFDYRQLYANILKDWMGVDQSTLTNDIFFRDFISGQDINGNNYEPFNLIKDNILGESTYINRNYKIESVYPNPANNYTQVKIFVNNVQNVVVELINNHGTSISSIKRKVQPGTHTFSFVLNNVSSGFYFIKAKSEMLNDTKKLIIRN